MMSRWMMRGAVLKGVMAATLLLSVIGGACDRLYFGQNAVESRLHSIPGVTVRAVWGSPDLPPRWYYATVDLTNGPSLFMFNLGRRAFDGGSGFCFFQVGAYAVRYVSERGSSNSLCFDESGDVAGLGNIFPRKIRDVRDFIEHSKEIERELARWPRCPDYEEVNGRETRYHVCTNPDISTPTWPSFATDALDRPIPQ
jgi:hypothetical protein